MDVKALKAQFNDKVRHFFRGLTFVADSHEYYVGGRKISHSVSGVVKSFVEEKDWDAIAEKVAAKKGMTKAEVLAIWNNINQVACKDGTATHNYAEDRAARQAKNNKEKAVDEFWRYLKAVYPGRYILMAKELRMYHKVFGFSGTCDFILFDTKTLMFVIGDYKTNKDLFKNFMGETLLPPFETMLDHPYNHYQIQLSLYEILFRQLGYKVSERWIIHLKADASFEKYNCFDLSELLINKLAA